MKYKKYSFICFENLNPIKIIRNNNVIQIRCHNNFSIDLNKEKNTQKYWLFSKILSNHKNLTSTNLMLISIGFLIPKRYISNLEQIMNTIKSINFIGKIYLKEEFVKRYASELIIKKIFNKNEFDSRYILNKFPKRQDYHGLIYKIANLINNKIYIGRTIQLLRRRWDRHKSDARQGRDAFVSRAIKRYKSENFIIEPIEKCYDDEEIKIREIYWISTLKSMDSKIGYNITAGGESIGYGIFHPKYIKIDKNSLIELIQKGYTRKEVGGELEISEYSVNDKINELFGDLGITTIEKAREYFDGKDLYDQKRFKKLSEARKGEGTWSYIKVDPTNFIDLLSQGLTRRQIGNVLGMHYQTVTSKIHEILGMSYREAREKFYLKPNIINLIQRGYIISEIAKNLGVSERTISNKIRNLCGFENIDQVREHFGGLELYKKRVSEKKTEIQQERFLEKRTEYKQTIKKFIRNGLNAKEIADYMELSYPYFLKLIRRLWKGKNFSVLRNNLFWRPTIKRLIINGLTAIEISDQLKYDQSSLYKKIKNLWNMNFEQLKNKLISKK